MSTASLDAKAGTLSRLVDTLIVAKMNHYGLSRDARLLFEAIRAAGGDVAMTDIASRGALEWLSGRKRARRVVHIERAHPRWFGAASEETILIPNQERFPRRQLWRLKPVGRVLAKTHHAETIFRARGARADYLGFLSEDRFDASVPKDWNRFFHLAGGSTLKGTADVLDLWRKHPEWPELVLVQKAANAPREVPENVKLLSGYVDDAALSVLQNGCGIHLCPSRAEGWGHYIVEALSCGAVVVTTDAPPMNEHIGADCGVLVAYRAAEARHLGQCFLVDPAALEAAVATLVAMPATAKAALGQRARLRYEAIVAGFTARLAVLLGAGAPRG